jgi:hypothetical protein
MPISINNTTLTFNDATTMTTAATSPIPATTVMLFYQNAAPTGWTIVTSQNNKALRVVSSSGGVAGGSVAFSTAFASQAVSGTVGTSGATTLTTAQIPSHSHAMPAGKQFGLTFAGNPIVGDGFAQDTLLEVNNGTNGGSTGSGGSHTHTGGTFTGTAINLAVQYIDVIIASKN